MFAQIEPAMTGRVKDLLLKYGKAILTYDAIIYVVTSLPSSLNVTLDEV